MSFTAAFWNINMGRTSNVNRINFFKGWCYFVKPDLLMLEEVGHTLNGQDMRDLTGMEPIDCVNTLDKNYKPSTKQLWALEQKGLGFSATPLRFPTLDQRRLLLKDTYQKAKYFQLWGIHANASAKGGEAATTAVVKFLDSEAGKGAIVGGDFNYPIANAGKWAVAPLSWLKDTNLNLTQWNKTDGITNGPEPDLHIISKQKIFRKVERHDVIDYLICDPQTKAAALPNMPPDETWWILVLTFFDHCPVLYQIG